MADRDHPVGRNARGDGYSCARCGADIPDGCQVFARYASAPKPTGVLVVDMDGHERHSCGSTVDPKNGQV